MTLICPECSNTMIWGADYDLEDYGIDLQTDGDYGIVRTFTCSNCGCTATTAYRASDDENSDQYIGSDCDVD